MLNDVKIPETLPQWMKDHVNLYLKSGGKQGHHYKCHAGAPDREPSLLLITKGRKTGEKYLSAVLRTGRRQLLRDRLKGGAPDHPGWYKNLKANPEVEVQVGTEHVRARARTAPGAERKRLWDEAIKFWPPYTEYQQKVPNLRDSVVVLDPVR